jgi:hypothetical protein
VKRIVLLWLLLLPSPCLAQGLLSLASTGPLTFNSGTVSRGMLMWEPYGDYGGSCSPCFPSGDVATYLPTGKLQVVQQSKVGTIRAGLDPGPFLVNPSSASSYWPNIFNQYTTIMAAGLKVIINNAPNDNWSGWTRDNIMDGGASSSNFLAYIAFLQSEANYIAANPTVCPPISCAIGVFNEVVSSNNVTGGAAGQYAEMVAMWQAVRTILPRHTIIVCYPGPSGFCSPFDPGNFTGWLASSFDANTIADFHIYFPPVAASACAPSSAYRDLCNITYPPTNSSTDYNNAVAAYAVLMAADSTWGGDCASAGASFTGGISGTTLTVSGVTGTIRAGQLITTGSGVTSNTFITAGSGTSWTVLFSQTVGSESMATTGGSSCSAARASNINEMINAFTYEGLTCYYGQGGGGAGSTCPSGQQENATWLKTNVMDDLIEAWRTSVVGGWNVNQVQIGEFGFAGVSSNGTGLSTTAQAQAFSDYTAAVDFYGYNRMTLEVNYSASSLTGSEFGLFNQGSPYATITPAAISALNFNWNYLLRRDFPGAPANDNRPLGLEEAA